MHHKQNLHTHTLFDDGSASPMAMAQAALDAGLESLGFSAHSPMSYESDWAVPADRLSDYRQEIARVREAFRGRLAIYDGLEWDASSPLAPVGFDYVIGSLHLIAPGRAESEVDNTPQQIRRLLDTRFMGDARAMIRGYFDQYAALADNPHVDIVGHLDLLTKFSERSGPFSSHDPYLLARACEAMAPLVLAGKIFEVNTGAMSRGLRKEPYPSVPLLRHLYQMGGRVTISSDAHQPEHITYGFWEMEALLRDVGFRETWIFNGKDFVPSPL